MKNIFLLFVLTIQAGAILWGQRPRNPCGDTIVVEQRYNVALNKQTYQSSNLTLGGAGPSLAVDGNTGSTPQHSSRTGQEINPWWEVDLEQKSLIASMQIWYSNSLYPGGLEDYYIFFSEAPFFSRSLEDALHDPEIRHIHLGNSIPSGSIMNVGNEKARFVRIQKKGVGTIGFYEVTLLGAPDPPGLVEICDNGIDDDGDCQVDCDDYDCKPRIWNVVKQDPTCVSCFDGNITIKSYDTDLEYSIDNGTTYTTCPPTGPLGECIFSGLGKGAFFIMVRKSVCTTSWPNTIELRAPEGDPSLSHCDNGDFESGTNSNWTGTFGTNVNGVYTITQTGITDFTTSGLHRIHSSGNWTDPLLNIPINAPVGTYFARVGSLFTVGTSVGGSLRYCLTVTPANAQNRFWYFMVMEDGISDHSTMENPFFQYRILNSSGVPIENRPPIIADLSNPFFSQGTGPIVYKDWTCVPLDMSNYIGQNICIEFIAVSCAHPRGGHRGYVYIDGLCTDPTPPSAVLVAPPDIYCLNQLVDIQVTNEFLVNRYQWVVSRLSPSNTTFDPVALEPQIGNTVPEFKDVLWRYRKDYPNYVFNCNDRFRVELRLFNDCSETVLRKDIRFSCNAYDLNYPDILVCNGEQDVIITGTNTCNGCSVEWSIARDPHNLPNTADVYLSSISSTSPTIRGTLNLYAFDMVYRVTVSTPEGCMYRDDVATINMSHLKGYIGDTITDICTFDSISGLSYIFPIDFSKYFNINYSIKGNYGQLPAETPFDDLPEENIPLVFLGQQGPLSNTISFRPTLKRLLRGFDQRITVSVTPKLNQSGVRVINSNCNRTFQHLRPNDSSLFGDINVYVPNAFFPLSVNEANRTIRPFFSHNIYEAWFQVFNRWGGQVHFAHVKSQNDQALTPTELDALRWNGVFQGQVVNNDVFVFVMDYQNCQITPADCFVDNLNGIDEDGIIAPQPATNDPDLYFPFQSIARGRRIRAHTSGGPDVFFNCTYFIAPNNKIINYDACSGNNVLNCSDRAHSGEIYKN